MQRNSQSSSSSSIPSTSKGVKESLQEQTNRASSSSTGSNRSRVPDSKAFTRVKVQDLLNVDEDSSNSVSKKSQIGGIPNIVCMDDGCGRKFASSESLVTHRKRQHAAPTSFVCSFCQSSYSSLPNLNKHVSMADSLLLTTISYSLPVRIAWSFHKLTHQKFPRSNLWELQIRSVHEKRKPFKCEQCPSSFAFKDGLQRHYHMVHDDIRPYPCSFCPLKFKTKSHLHKHLLALHPRDTASSSKK